LTGIWSPRQATASLVNPLVSSSSSCAIHHKESERQGRAGQGKTWQGKIGYDRTGQDRTGQDRTGQDRTGQDRTGQDRTVAQLKQNMVFEPGQEGV
jgi:hypothetical protein